MRLFDHDGHRLYLNQNERADFLEAAQFESPEKRVLCQLLYYTGCRPSEALELTPERIFLDERTIVIRTLKKRKLDAQGNPKPPAYRNVPVPDVLIKQIDLVFDLRRTQKNKRLNNKPLWPMSRATAWHMIKRVMGKAGIEGAMATTKGLRHGLGIALAMQKVSATAIRDILGHSDTKTTEIYTTAVGDELRELASRTWV